MSLPASTHSKIHEQLSALAHRLAAFGGLDAELQDVEVIVTHRASGRSEVITCAPRPEDDGRLWFWDSQRRPIAEAERVVDAAVEVAARLQS